MGMWPTSGIKTSEFDTQFVREQTPHISHAEVQRLLYLALKRIEDLKKGLTNV